MTGSEMNYDKGREGWGERMRSGFAYAKDRGPAHGADALDGGLAVLERDVLRILDLSACLALYTVCFWHIHLKRRLPRSSI